MSVSKPSTKATKPKTNVIAFPIIHNKSNNHVQAELQTQLVLTQQHNQNKETKSQATIQENRDNIMLVFEVLLTLKQQLDNIENQLDSLSKTSFKQ